MTEKPRIMWKAVYKDGSSLPQFSGDVENKYTDIDRDKLAQFILCQSDVPVLVIHLDEGKRLICRRRVAMHISGVKAGTQEIVVLAGWQENRQGINIQCVCFVFEDGHVEVLDRFREGSRWFYGVQFLPEEQP